MSSSGINDWRSTKTAQEFYESFGVPEDAQIPERFLTRSGTFQEGILEQVHTFLESISLNKQIIDDFAINTQLFRDDGTPARQDTRVKLWTQLIKAANYGPYEVKSTNVYREVLRTHAGSDQSQLTAHKTFVQKVEGSFHKKEQSVQGRPLVSKVVLEQICNLSKQYHYGSHLAPFTSLVGPSGIGKSFVFQSIARSGDAYVIYVSFADSLSLAYPTRSSIANWLLEDELRGNCAMTSRFECFIAAHIRQTQYCLQNGISPFQFYEMQIKNLPEYFKWRRDMLRELKSLEEHALAYDSMPPSKISKAEPGDFSHHSNPGRDFRSDEHKSIFDYGKYVHAQMEEYEKSIGPIFKAVETGNQETAKMPESNQPIIFCFDEASELLRYDNNPFLSLRRALRHQHRHVNTRKFFAVLLDTSAKYNTFVPLKPKDPSLKFPSDPRDQFKPIFEIPSFDIMATPQKEKDLSCDIKELELFSYGRPNWSSFMEKFPVRNAVELATQKLYGGRSSRDLNEGSLTSMVSWRLPFNIVWHYFAEDLVAHHMRMIYDISDDRTILETAQPSEPILAWVAYRQMTVKTAKISMLKNLAHQCSLGSIDLGDIGEIVASLILLFAFDESQKDEPFPKPQPLTKFLKLLFGTETFQYQEKKYHGQTSSEMKDLWKHGHVFFNHFTRLEGEMSEDVLRKAWMRGSALIAYPNTHHYDLAIPVSLPKKNKITCILVQVKNRKDDRVGNAIKNEAKILMAEAEDSFKKRGMDVHFLIFMALRANGKPTVDFDLTNPLQSHSTMSLRRTPRPEKAQNYIAIAYGLDGDIYPSLAASGNERTAVVSYLQALLRIKSSDKWSKLSEYQKSLAPLFQGPPAQGRQ